MNTKQMTAALKTFGGMLVGSEGESLAKFAKVFDGLGEAKVTAVVTQVTKNWKTEKRLPKRPVQLERAVRRIENALALTGAKSQAVAFGKVATILSGAVDQDLDSFIQEVIEARVKKAPAPKPPKPTKPKFADQVPLLAQRLALASWERSQFDALLAEYEKRHKGTELKAIADRFLGYDVGAKMKKGDIVKAIRNWQREDELNRSNRASQAKAGL